MVKFLNKLGLFTRKQMADCVFNGAELAVQVELLNMKVTRQRNLIKITRQSKKQLKTKISALNKALSNSNVEAMEALKAENQKLKIALTKALGLKLEERERYSYLSYIVCLPEAIRKKMLLGLTSYLETVGAIDDSFDK